MGRRSRRFSERGRARGSGEGPAGRQALPPTLSINPVDTGGRRRASPTPPSAPGSPGQPPPPPPGLPRGLPRRPEDPGRGVRAWGVGVGGGRDGTGRGGATPVLRPPRCPAAAFTVQRQKGDFSPSDRFAARLRFTGDWEREKRYFGTENCYSSRKKKKKIKHSRLGFGHPGLFLAFLHRSWGSTGRFPWKALKDATLK